MGCLGRVMERGMGRENRNYKLYYYILYIIYNNKNSLFSKTLNLRCQVSGVISYKFRFQVSGFKNF